MCHLKWNTGSLAVDHPARYTFVCSRLFIISSFAMQFAPEVERWHVGRRSWGVRRGGGGSHCYVPLCNPADGTAVVARCYPTDGTVVITSTVKRNLIYQIAADEAKSKRRTQSKRNTNKPQEPGYVLCKDQLN